MQVFMGKLMVMMNMPESFVVCNDDKYDYISQWVSDGTGMITK